MFLPRDADRVIGAAVAGPLGVVHVPLRAAAGRVLAQDIATDQDQPPFDRVAMDGIAIRCEDWHGGTREFRILRTQGAGVAPLPLLGAGNCVEIMTGAVLPPGADAVIPVERLRVVAGVACVDEGANPAVGVNIHARGSDQVAGAVVLRAGMRLRAPEVAVLASAGRTSVPVIRPPKVVVVSTGDELVEPDVRPEPWQVRRSNAYGIVATLIEHGYAEVHDAHLPDDLALLTRRLAALLDTADVIVLSGGVSAGRFDHVPAALAAVGVEQRFHKVAQRPGRPLWFGSDQRGRLAFGLPGNPVSTLICLVRYVLPALARLEGEAIAAPPALLLSAPVRVPAELALFMPVDLTPGPDGPRATPHPTQGSGDFTSLVGTAGFVELATGQTPSLNEPVPFYHW